MSSGVDSGDGAVFRRYDTDQRMTLVFNVSWHIFTGFDARLQKFSWTAAAVTVVFVVMGVLFQNQTVAFLSLER